MADALLSVEVIAKMEQLSAGLKRSQAEVLSFVQTSSHAIRSLQGALNSLGFQQGAQQARQFTGAVRDAGNMATKAAGQINSASASARHFASSQNAATSAMNNAGNAATKTSGPFRSMIAQLAGVGAALETIRYAFNQNIQVDSIKTSLTYLLGSADEMEIRYARLKQRADDYGLSVNSLGGAYQLFIGSAKAANQDLEIAEQVFYSLSKAGAVLHLSQEKVASSLYAVQQMMDKGTVQSEELKRQLGNALPGSMAIMAKAVAAMTGKVSVSNDELMKMMKRGEIISSEVLPFFARELEKTFGLDKVEKVESLQASFERLGNSLTSLTTGNGRLAQLFQIVIDGAADAVTAIDRLINSSSWKEFVLRVMSPQNTNNADNIMKIAKSAQEASKMVASMSKIDVGGMDKSQLEATAKAIRQTINSMVEPYNKAQNDIKKGIWGYDVEEVNKQKVYYNYLQSKLGQIAILMKGLPDAAKTPAKVQVDTDDALTSINDIKKRIAELSKLDGSAIKGSEIYNRIQALKSRLSTRKGSTGPSDAEKAALKAQQDWDKKVADSMAATGKFILDAIAAQSEAEVAAEKERQDALMKVLEAGDLITEELFNIIDAPRKKNAEAIDETLKNFHDFVDGMSDMANQFVGDAVGQFAEGIGLMIAGDLSLKDFGKGMISSMGSFLAQFGKQLIAFATASLLFTKLKAAIKAGGPGAIPAAIALIGAGIALTVIGSAIQGAMDGNGSGGGSGRNGGNNVRGGFANGVTNFGGGLALVGERGPEIVTLPSGSNVTPTTQTQRMLQGGQQVYIPDMVLRGEDIYVSFKKAEKRLDRV